MAFIVQVTAIEELLIVIYSEYESGEYFCWSRFAHRMAVSGFASSILNKIHEIVSGGAVSVLHSYNGRSDAVAGPSTMMQIQVWTTVVSNFFIQF